MTVYVNARFLTHEVTGVERYAREISTRLLGLRNDLVFLVPSGPRDRSLDGILRVREIGNATGHRWEQIDLPRYLRGQHSPLLISLMSTAPMNYPNQISTKHDITPVRFPQSYSKGFRAFYGIVVPRMLRNSRAVITPSEFSRSELASHYGIPKDKIHVIHAAVGGEFRPTSAQRDDEPYLMALSSPSAHKNFDRLIETFSRIDFRPQVELKIVGGQTKSLQGGGASATNGVSFLGRLDDDAVINLYQRATAFVFPSLYEGFGIPPLEAQACGTPVIASDAASIPEVLGDSALYFDPYDLDSMATRMLRVVQDSTLRTSLVQRGFQNVARFSWDESARRVSALIDSVSRQRKELSVAASRSL